MASGSVYRSRCSDRAGDDLAPVDPAIGFQVGASTQSLSGPPSWSGNAVPPLPTTRLRNRPGWSAAAKSAAAVPTSGPTRCGCSSPNASATSNDELAHRPAATSTIAALGLPEPRQVDRHQMGVLREARPDRLVGSRGSRATGSAAARGRSGLTLGEANRQPVDGAELRPDRLAQRCRHGTVPFCSCQAVTGSRRRKACRSILLAKSSLRRQA